MASTGGRYSVITKSPLTGAVACSNSGGFHRRRDEERRLGHDHFRGQGAKPVYLYFENENASCCRPTTCGASRFGQADEALHTKHQDPQLRIAAVGRAAEAGCSVLGGESTICTAPRDAPGWAR